MAKYFFRLATWYKVGPYDRYKWSYVISPITVGFFHPRQTQLFSVIYTGASNRGPPLGMISLPIFLLIFPLNHLAFQVWYIDCFATKEVFDKCGQGCTCKVYIISLNPHVWGFYRIWFVFFVSRETTGFKGPTVFWEKRWECSIQPPERKRWSASLNLITRPFWKEERYRYSWWKKSCTSW